MGPYLQIPTALAIVVMLVSGSSAGVKNVPYIEVKVTVSEVYKPDAAFEKMRRAFVEAAAKKDSAALFALVGPTFVWTMNGGRTDQFDMGRDALQNFKVLFGFRGFNKDTDGGVEDGPYWEALAEFAAETAYNSVPDAGNLVCGPLAAEVVNEQVLENARKKLETGDDGIDWYFTLNDVAVAKAPGDTGAPVARLGKVAVPVLDVHPEVAEGQPAVPATHLQVLAPNGKTGWIPASAARPLVSDRLCYAKTSNGEWKIVAYDQSQ